MISAVVSDLDGTILETEEVKALAHARAVRELRPEVEESEVVAAYADGLVGRSRREVSVEMTRRFGLEDALRSRGGSGEPWEVLVEIRHGIYEELLRDSDLLLEKRYEHNINLIRELRGRGFPTALATMSHRHQVERILAVLGIEDLFDVVATADDITSGKPDPEIYLLAAGRLGVSAGEVLAVEDSAAGVRAALAAGMAVVAVPTDMTRKGLREAEILDERWIAEPDSVLGVVEDRMEKSGGGRFEKPSAAPRKEGS